MATKAPKVGKIGLKAEEIAASPILKGLEFLCQTFGGEMDAWERKAYERTLAGIDGGVIAEAAQLLVDEASAGRQFYPIPKAPDWKAACVKVIQRRRCAIAANETKCEECHGTRWIHKTVNGRSFDVRCECHMRLMAAMDAVGKLLELPAADSRPEQHGDGYDGKMRAIGGVE